MKTHPAASRMRSQELPQGFSLIATITILVLLSLIAIGLLSLSAITVRSGSAELAQLEARANARLSLMLAIGELQRTLGPDRRVSAAAAVLDENPDTLSIDGVDNPHWTGVWSTEWEGDTGARENKTPWVRNDEEGGLSDLRYEEGYDREREVLNYLVSGNEGGKAVLQGDFLDARSAALGDDDESVRLVGPGSILENGRHDEEQEVYAMRVPTIVKGRERGAYAFWVGDQNIKANIGQVDHYSQDSPTPGGGPEGMERLTNAQDLAGEMIDEKFSKDSIDDEEVQRLVSLQTLVPAQDPTGPGGVEQAQDLVKENFHYITTNSKSVLANVRQGRLQRDLTAYIYSNGVIDELQDGGRTVSYGISDLDNMVGPANPERSREQGTRWQETKYRDISPKFALIRKWANLGARLGWSERDHEMIVPASVTDNSQLRGMLDGVNVYDGGNLRPAAFLPHDELNLFPVMTEASMFYNLASYPERPGSTNTQNILRICIYPRVALWNPYNVQLDCGPMVATMFVNGNKDVQVQYGDGTSRQVPIPFGRGSTKVGAMSTTLPDISPGHYVGWMLFNIPETTFAPGETLVFSPQRTAEYNISNVSRNALSSTVAPDPALYFYQDMQTRHDKAPTSFIEFPGGGNSSGGDNYMMSLKDTSAVNGRVTDSNFNSLPSIVYANTSLQAGGSDELPVQWNARQPVPVHPLTSSRDRLGGGAIPDVRTRDGFRMRWWVETRSNIRGSGQLNRNPEHLQTAAIANWNPRAAYFCRNPWDNITDIPPHFYGLYTRDLFDPAVSWQETEPRPKDGKMLGFPFGQPLDGPDQVVLFEIPRSEVGIPSIAYLRHLKLSEFGWHPSYAIGSSLADPRTGRTTTSPVMTSSREKQYNGWNQHLFGWAAGRDSGRGPDYWAMLTRQILFLRPEDHFVVYDLSYELNFNFWDNFFMSTGTASRKSEFINDPLRDPLPNGRMQLIGKGSDVEDDLNDFHRAASQLYLDGGFNVHSVSKDSWKALLASTIDTGFSSTEDSVPFPRLLDPPEGEWNAGRAEDPEATAGFRSVSEEDLDRLAEEIVREVKERAPFFGLSDFVNRRLVRSEHGEKGPLEAAIEASGLNAEFETGDLAIVRDRDLPDISFDNMQDATRLDQTLKPPSVAWGLPGYLTQGDILGVIGSTLRPRSDTFLVRGYGESVDNRGNVRARAWCEAVVQRTPEPVNPDGTGLNPIESDDGTFIDFGRRFRVTSFRWLSPDEV